MSGIAMRLVIVSGLSGSGKSVALNVLEDLGWYCVDNIPAALINDFIAHSIRRENQIYDRCAVGVDARNEPDDIARVPQLAQDLRRSGIECEMIFLHAAEDALVRRYGDTRRRHPLARIGVDLKAAIAEELRLLEPITYSADLVIDTTHTSVHELREVVRARVERHNPGKLSIMFESFGYKYGIPGGADFVFDARTLPNPYWDPALRPLNGCDPAVVQFLSGQPTVMEFLDDVTQFVARRLPLYSEKNRAYLTVAIGCTGGQHRSVFLVDRLKEYFAARYPDVGAHHGALAKNS
jgi:UPF0042 nucleotide-binding protein